jgi:hypothetical protein
MNKKFGFYQIGSLTTVSKMEAIELHHKTGIHPTWNFNDEVFGTVDWTQEPSESLWEIYCQRAQQLREKYDYLVLFFSGGADSTNILDSFIKNGIHVDEILCYHMYQGSQNKLAAGEVEIFNVALPVARAVCEQHPNIKLREVDLTESVVKYYGDKRKKFDLVYDINDMWTPNHLGLTKIKDQVPEWQRILDSGKTIGMINGIDKPRVYFENNRYCLKFLDVLISNNIDVGIMRNTNQEEQHELFYWTPDLPKIIIKQAHAVRKFLESATEHTPGLVKTQTLFPAKVINGEQYWLTSHALNQLIYPTWDINTFTIGKFLTPLASPRDTWFFTKSEFSKEFEIYKLSLDAIKTIAQEYWLNDVDQITRGTKGMWSKTYYLS